MRYLMTGTQRVDVGGRIVDPGIGEFEAEIEPGHESFLVGIGALKRIEEPRPRLRRREVAEE